MTAVRVVFGYPAFRPDLGPRLTPVKDRDSNPDLRGIPGGYRFLGLCLCPSHRGLSYTFATFYDRRRVKRRAD